MRCPDCGQDLKIGDWPYPCAGAGHEPGPMWTGDAAIHTSERAVMIRNPRTGETRIPGRADRPTHPKYLRAGFTERVELTHQDIREMEKQGMVHEPSNYDSPHSSSADRDTASGPSALPRR